MRARLCKGLLLVSCIGLFLYVIFIFTAPIPASGRNAVTLIKLEKLDELLSEYFRREGRFPPSAHGLDLLISFGKSIEEAESHSLAVLSTDGYGQEFVYIYPARYSKEAFDLYSVGANGADEHGQGDDFPSWNMGKFDPEYQFLWKHLLWILPVMFLLSVVCIFYKDGWFRRLLATRK